jgi:hypothetical protein
MIFVRLILFFFLFLSVNFSADPVQEFFIFHERFKPESKAPLPPTDETLAIYSALSEIERYFFLEKYFRQNSNQETENRPDRILLLHCENSDLEKLQQVLPIRFQSAYPAYKIYEIKVPDFYPDTAEFIKLLKDTNPRIHVEIPAPTSLYIPSSSHESCNTHHLEQIEWSKALMEIEKSLPRRLKKIKVAVFDTGIANHPALNLSVQDQSLNKDQHGHGTHVAGIIAAGFAGIAPEAVILKNYPVLGKNGQGNIAELIAAMVKAEQEGSQIMHLSLSFPDYSRVFYDLLTNLSKKGIIIIAAAGNNSSKKAVFPAAHPLVIGVGALNKENGQAAFSNSGDNAAIFLPGENICSTWPPNSARVQSGTSAAAPVFTGLLAEMLSRSPKNLDSYEILETLSRYNLRNISEEQKAEGQQSFSAPYFFDLLQPLLQP